ncbi:MAG: family 1 encapsulin nanocompartment shell protein [Myxococcota bacterium]
MIGLNRELAPISPKAWEAIETEAREVLELHLAARRLVDFDGPHGWDHSALDLGRVEELESHPTGALVRRRVVRPLIELRVPFELDRAELERIDRGAAGADLDPLRDAARVFAAAEDSALFEGYADADIPGLLTDSAHDGVELPKDAAELPGAVSEALERLRQAGVAGPYAVALGPGAYGSLDRGAADGGYPVLRHVQRLIDWKVVWAPSLRGGLVLSLRGGDFELVCGRDASIGYLGHDDAKVRLYLEESFSAELSGPEAFVPMLGG